MAESLCTLTPGFCMKQADCPDSHCNGRWMAVQLHLRDGGHKVVQPDSTRLYLERHIAEPPTRRRRRSPFTPAEIACAAGGAVLGLSFLYLFGLHMVRHVFNS